MNNILELLSQPFQPSDVHWRVGATNIDKRTEGLRWGDEPMGVPLAYIDARNVQERLDSVCGTEWQDEHPREGYCRIGIKINGEWIWRGNGAGQTDIEGEKGQYSDAFKRAAVQWGIGRYLYGFKFGFKPLISVKKKDFTDTVMQELKKTLVNHYKNNHYLIDYNATVRDMFETISAIKLGIQGGDFSGASEAYFELTDEEKTALNLAPTFGGIFTPDEREIMKSAEFRQAFYGEQAS